MPVPSRKSRALRFAASAAMALCVHGLTFGYLAWAGVLSPSISKPLPLIVDGLPEREGESEPLSVESLVDEIEKPPKPSSADTKAAKEREEKDPKGQVVDIAQPAIEQRPDQSKFLSEYDAMVLHETKGAVGRDKAGAKVAPTPPSPFVPPSPPSKLPPGDPRAELPKNGLLALRGPSGDKLPGPTGQKADVRSLGPDGTLAHQAGQGAVSPSERVGAQTLPGMGPLRLTPSQESLQRALGQGSGSPDYLGDLDDGDATSLSSRKWKFAAFFNRMKSQVREEWHPDQLLSRHDPSGNIYGSKDRVTMLKVELSLDGRVKDVSVVKPSGVEFLDDEAMSAFRRAQPFSNPPEPLADPDGIIRFQFGFVVQVSGYTSFRVR
ncbi:MAG TPA: energy transducer TonB, partial [Pseudomonadota bacterium]|nr:energy transducer TonB [Pseudomonadota bacterium]